MQAIIFGLIASFGFGVGDFLGGLAAKKIGGVRVSFWINVFGLLLGALYTPFVFSDLQNAPVHILLFTIVLGAIYVIPVVSFYEGMRVGNASLVGTIANAFPFVSVLISLIFLGETIHMSQVIAISVIICGIVLSTLRLEKGRRNILSDPGIPYALVTLVGWGVHFALIKIPVQEMGWFWPSYIPGILMLPSLILLMRFRKLPQVSGTQKLLPLIALTSLLLNGAVFAYNFAIQQGQAAIAAPLAGSSPWIFVLLSFLFFREPLRIQQGIGIFITLVGIVLLSLFSV